MSDDADKGSYSGDQESVVTPLDDFTLTSTNTFALSLWSGHYNSIGACNQALQALVTAAIDTGTKIELNAEVRFVRGYLYFNLVRMFGGVPLILFFRHGLQTVLYIMSSLRICSSLLIICRSGLQPSRAMRPRVLRRAFWQKCICIRKNGSNALT
jgi:hypothetical protein